MGSFVLYGILISSILFFADAGKCPGVITQPLHTQKLEGLWFVQETNCPLYTKKPITCLQWDFNGRETNFRVRTNKEWIKPAPVGFPFGIYANPELGKIVMYGCQMEKRVLIPGKKKNECAWVLTRAQFPDDGKWFSNLVQSSTPGKMVLNKINQKDCSNKTGEIPFRNW